MPRVSEINTINKLFFMWMTMDIYVYISKYKDIAKLKFLDISAVYQNLKNLYLYKINNIYMRYILFGDQCL